MGSDWMNGHDHDIESRLREPLWFDEIMRPEQGSRTDPAEMIYGCGGCFILLLIALLPLFLIGACAGTGFRLRLVAGLTPCPLAPAMVLTARSPLLAPLRLAPLRAVLP